MQFLDNSPYYTNDTVSITCAVRGLSDKNIFISKVTIGPNGVGKLGVVGRFTDGSSLSLKPSEVTALSSGEGDTIWLTALFKDPTCSDSGSFECLAAGTEYTDAEVITFEGNG